ncbi:MAG: hypothetical protein ABIF71_06670 [Planctomycetota bacterium]
MKILAVIGILATMVFGAAAVQAGEYPERWNYVNGNTLTPENTAKFLELLRGSKAAGCTHVLWSGCRGFRIPEMTDEQRAGDKAVQAEAKNLGLTVIPGIISIGYSGRYFHIDPNLAAGVPVRNMPYVVKGGRAEPDPALALDTAQPVLENGVLTATFKVPPFMYYRVNFTMTADPGDLEDVFKVTSSGGKRWNSRSNPTVTKEGELFKLETVFNTLEADSIKVAINDRGGKINAVRIEPAGMLLVLRRDTLPLVVANADGTATFEEGKDFAPVADPVLQVKPFPGDFPIDHPAPGLVLTERSRLKEGDRLSVSFYHHIRVYTDQDLISLEDERVWAILETEIKETVGLWNAAGYMLNYDEIRVAGWEARPKSLEGLTMGRLLAKHFKRTYDLVRKYAPEAKIYTWSDMFTPYHNARNFADGGFYYLVNGTWDGAWEGLPADVIILNWYAPKPEGVKFFADRGNPQVLCGYYDGRSEEDMRKNIAAWKQVAAGLPGVRGFMYTTWRNDYKNLAKYFELLDSFAKWGAQSEQVTR